MRVTCVSQPMCSLIDWRCAALVDSSCSAQVAEEQFDLEFIQSAAGHHTLTQFRECLVFDHEVMILDELG